MQRFFDKEVRHMNIKRQGRWLMAGLALMLVTGPTLAADLPTEADRNRLQQELQEAREAMQAAARRMAEISAALHEGEFAPQMQRMARIHMPRGRLGVSVRDSDDPAGARVERVLEDSPAGKAGIRQGDVIVAVNGQALGDRPTSSLRERIVGHQGDAPARLTVNRDGGIVELEVLVEDPWRLAREVERHMPAPADMERIHQRVREATQGMRGMAWNRVRLWSMNEDLAAYFGVGEGVLVLDAPDSESMPLRAGDVIVAVGGEPANSPRDVVRALRGRDGDAVVEIVILRQGQRTHLSVERTNGPLALLNTDFLIDLH
jgi:S1-C subfamily serine protease